MSTDHFTKSCAKAKLAVPTADKDVRKLLADAGATVLDAKTATASKLRKEHAAAVVWARENIDKDRSWTKIPGDARDTLIALFPISQTIIDKGGNAWAAPCRALIRAYGASPEPPKKRVKSAQVSKGTTSEDESASGSTGDEKTPPPEKEKPAKKSAKDKDKGKADSDGTLPPYLPSVALLAVLPPHRRAQLYLAEAWNLKTRSEREKELARITAVPGSGGRFEDPASPAWSQRISVMRGPGSPFSDDEVQQDGRNLASMMRWDSVQVLYANGDHEAVHRMTSRAERVRASWERFNDGGRKKVAPSSAILAAITRAIQDTMAIRLTSAELELGQAGPAGAEILQDMARQKQEVADLFASYELFLACLFANPAVDYNVATRRANSIWFGLLQPSVALLTQDSGTALKDGLEAKAEAAFNLPAPVTPAKRTRTEAEEPVPHSSPAPVQPPPPGAPQGGMPMQYAPFQYSYSPYAGQGAAGGASYALPPPPYPAPPAYQTPMSPGPASGPPPAHPKTPPTVEKNTNQNQPGAAFLPVSAAVVGTSRGSAAVPRRPCARGVCALKEEHYPWECPLRYLAVCGTEPPGFLPSGAKDPAAWNGSEITPVTAAAWKSFLGNHPELSQAPKINWVTNFD